MLRFSFFAFFLFLLHFLCFARSVARSLARLLGIHGEVHGYEPIQSIVLCVTLSLSWSVMEQPKRHNQLMINNIMFYWRMLWNMM